MILNVSIDRDQYNSIIRALQNVSKSEESVIKTAVNNAAKATQKDIATRVSKNYSGNAGKRSTVLSTSSIRKATTANPTAVITYESGVRDVRDYQARIGKKAISVQVRKNGFKRIPGAFVVGLPWQSKDGRSGIKEAIVVRQSKTVAKKYSGKPAIPHYNKIKKLLSPSVAKQAGNSEVYSADRVSELLYAEVDKVMSKVLGD